MKTLYTKKLVILSVVISVLIVLKSFAVQQQQREKQEVPKNLKILPKNMPGEEVITIMKVFSRSLGIRCDHCHVGTPQDGKMKFDFASDEKPEKDLARKMMVMTDSINTAFLGKLKLDGDDLEKITCVTCHRGSLRPMVSVDSLPRPPMPGNKQQ